MTDQVQLGKRLRAAREAKGLSQTEAGAAIHLRSAQAISYIEAGKRGIDALRLRDLARLYGVSVAWLLGDDSPPPDSEEFMRLFGSLSALDQKHVLGYLRFLHDTGGRNQ